MRSAPTLVIASVWRRVLAYLLDGLIVGIIATVATEVGLLHLDSSGWQAADAGSLALLLVISSAYQIGFIAAQGATPGKMALGIHVANRHGRRVQPDTAILRCLIQLIGALPGLLISLMLMIFSPQRRTLHDRVAGTLVIMGRPGSGADDDDGAHLSQPDRGI